MNRAVFIHAPDVVRDSGCLLSRPAAAALRNCFVPKFQQHAQLFGQNSHVSFEFNLQPTARCAFTIESEALHKGVDIASLKGIWCSGMALGSDTSASIFAMRPRTRVPLRRSGKTWARPSHIAGKVTAYGFTTAPRHDLRFRASAHAVQHRCDCLRLLPCAMARFALP